jgi:hypothetical protein
MVANPGSKAPRGGCHRLPEKALLTPNITKMCPMDRRMRIPTKADTCSNPKRTPIPIDIGQLSERSDALGLVINECPICVKFSRRFSELRRSDASSREPETSSRRAFARAGERRRRTPNLQFASPPVATRNGLAPPVQIGAPLIIEFIDPKASGLGGRRRCFCAWSRP